MNKILYLSLALLVSGCAASRSSSALAIWRSPHATLERRVCSAVILVPLNTPFPMAKHILGEPSSMMAIVVFGKGIVSNAMYDFDNGSICLSLDDAQTPDGTPDTNKMIVTAIGANVDRFGHQ
jgi:hypothetical protein